MKASFFRTAPLCAACLALALAPGTPSSAAEPTHEQSAMELFRERCSGDHFAARFEARFAPLRRLDSDRLEAGKWKYEFATADKRYKDGRYALSDGSGSIDFVSSMHADGGDARPDYIWHVISVPVSGPRTRTRWEVAFAARYDAFQAEQGLWSDATLRELEESSVPVAGDARNLMFLDSRLGRSKRRDLRKAWVQAFQNAMDQLVLPSQSVGAVYSHTFYYHGVLDADVQIGAGGDRRNSNRSLRQSGIALGFVLDPQGNCLTAASLDIRDDAARDEL